MKRSLVGILSVLALAVAIPVMAQSEQTASGTVVSSSATQIVIQTADGRRITFMRDANTNAPSNLQQGSPVTVRYHDMNGTMHAASVTAGSAPTSTSATGATATDRTRPAADPTGNDARTSAQPETTATTGAQRDTATAAQDPDTGATRLPATASPLPLVGLSGLIALAGGLGVRVLRRRQ